MSNINLAHVRHTLIVPVVGGTYSFRSRADAEAKLTDLSRRFTIAADQKDRGPDDGILLWIKGFGLTDEERIEGVRGSFARVRVVSGPDSRWTLAARKEWVPPQQHPEPPVASGHMPPFYHWLFKKAEKGFRYPNLSAARADLRQMHEEFPDSTVPGGTRDTLLCNKWLGKHKEPMFVRIELEATITPAGDFQIRMTDKPTGPRQVTQPPPPPGLTPRERYKHRLTWSLQLAEGLEVRLLDQLFAWLDQHKDEEAEAVSICLFLPPPFDDPPTKWYDTPRGMPHVRLTRIAGAADRPAAYLVRSLITQQGAVNTKELALVVGPTGDWEPHLPATRKPDVQAPEASPMVSQEPDDESEFDPFPPPDEAAVVEAPPAQPTVGAQGLPGEAVKGVVRTVTNNMAIVDLDGGGFGHLTVDDIRWVRAVAHPLEVLAVGEAIACTILSRGGMKGGRIQLAAEIPADRPPGPNPWAGAATKYASGAAVSGTVQYVSDKDTVVELEPGVTGKVTAVGAAGWFRPNVGERVECVVLELDPTRMRLKLGWAAGGVVGEAVPPAPAAVRGWVSGTHKRVAFVELADGRRGSLAADGRAYQAGDEVEVVVAGFDPRLDLLKLATAGPGRKPPPTEADRFRPGDALRGTVTGAKLFGVFVEIEPGVVALLHRTKIADPPPETAEGLWAIGEPIDVTVHKSGFADGQLRVELTRLSRTLADAPTASCNPSSGEGMAGATGGGTPAPGVTALPAMAGATVPTDAGDQRADGTDSTSSSSSTSPSPSPATSTGA